MNEILKPGLRLFYICAAAALALGLVNFITDPVIRERKAAVELTATQSLISGDISEQYVALPPAIGRADFENELLAKIKTDSQRAIMLEAYRLGPDDAYVLKKNLSPDEMTVLSTILASVGFHSNEVVRGYRLVKEAGALKGFALELYGRGYGGEMKLIAAYQVDGTLINAKLLDNGETPGIGKDAEQDGYMKMFFGKNKMGIPVVKNMLTEPDAVSGATITFMGVGTALRSGSLYLEQMGGQ
jgi:Na+-translocating ferredoxin:NAD+ oxidoreductase RnfG subunit